MKNHVINIRADANPDIGTGHVMRCIALGQAFKESGGDVHFITDCKIKPIESRLHNEGFWISKISSCDKDPHGLEQMMQILRSQRIRKAEKQKERFQWVVLDGYHFGESVQQSIKENGFKLMIIDDYNHNLSYHGDMLLNPNIGAESFQYKTTLDTVMLKGLKYALVRKEFLQADIYTPLENAGKTHILVTMGGSDPLNITPTIIKGIHRLKDPLIKSKIVIGPADEKASDLETYITQKTRMELIKNGDMPNLMKWADFAITAAGSTCTELCHLGVPFLSIIAADNQEALAKNFEKAGISINLGWFSKITDAKIAAVLNSFIKDTTKRKEMALLSKKNVDGQGCARIIRQMERITYNGL